MDSCPPNTTDYFTYRPMHALLWIQLLCSIAAVAIVIYTIVYHVRKSWFEGVFKETLYALYVVIVWHSAFTIILQAKQISVRLLASNACDILFDKGWCFLRVIITLAYPAFPCLHAAVTVQRIITTYSGDQKHHRRVARACLAITLFYCIAYIVIGYYNYPIEGLTPYCSGIIPGYINVINAFTVVMFCLDVLNVLIAFALIHINMIKIRELKARAPLSEKFRYRQTLRSIEQTLPVAFIHLACFSVQYVLFQIDFDMHGVEFVTLYGYIYTAPYYCVVCAATLLWLMIREERAKKRELDGIHSATTESHADEYFVSLEMQWVHSYGALNKRKIEAQRNRRNRIAPASA